MSPSPTPGPRLRKKHRLPSTAAHSSIGSLFTVLDMRNAHEQLTFREALRALVVDPTMGCAPDRRESTKLNDDDLRGLATRFLDQTRLPPRNLTAGQTYFPSTSIAPLHCLRPKKYSYDEYREDIIRLVTQVLISQRDGVRRREREKKRERLDQLPSIPQGDASLARESSSDSDAPLMRKRRCKPQVAPSPPSIPDPSQYSASTPHASTSHEITATKPAATTYEPSMPLLIELASSVPEQTATHPGPATTTGSAPSVWPYAQTPLSNTRTTLTTVQPISAAPASVIYGPHTSPATCPPSVNNSNKMLAGAPPVTIASILSPAKPCISPLGQFPACTANQNPTINGLPIFEPTSPSKQAGIATLRPLTNTSTSTLRISNQPNPKPDRELAHSTSIHALVQINRLQREKAQSWLEGYEATCLCLVNLHNEMIERAARTFGEVDHHLVFGANATRYCLSRIEDALREEREHQRRIGGMLEDG